MIEDVCVCVFGQQKCMVCDFCSQCQMWMPLVLRVSGSHSSHQTLCAIVTSSLRFRETLSPQAEHCCESFPLALSSRAQLQSISTDFLSLEPYWKHPQLRDRQQSQSLDLRERRVSMLNAGLNDSSGCIAVMGRRLLWELGDSCFALVKRAAEVKGWSVFTCLPAGSGGGVLFETEGILLNDRCLN